MIEKEIDGYTGEVRYCRCTICKGIWNYDTDTCPLEKEHKT